MYFNVDGVLDYCNCNHEYCGTILPDEVPAHVRVLSSKVVKKISFLNKLTLKPNWTRLAK